MNAKRVNTILLPLESYLYLQDKSYFERCGKHGSEKRIERLKKNFEEFSYNGYKQLCDCDLGGCVGNWENAYEERRWTSWSCEDMKRFLNEANLPYKEGKKTEVIEVLL